MILISGAGVGGLWTCHELLQAGVPADQIQLLEASPELLPALGGSFALSGGLQCFQASSSSEFKEKLSQLQCQPSSFHYMEVDGLYEYGKMEGMDTEFPVYGHFLRGELIALLAETLPDGMVLLDHQVVKILKNDETGVQVQVRRGDGTIVTFDGDVLIGADGIHSTVRRECFGSKPQEFVGINMIYFVIPAKDIQDIIDTNPLLQSDAMVAVDDPSGLLLPTGSKEHRSWVFCSSYRSQYALEGVQEWEQPKEEQGNKDPALNQVLDKIAAAASQKNAALPLQAMMQHASRKMNFSLYQTSPCYEEWYHKRVVLLGDAIHATTPFLGRGANEAIQSATCLARILGSSPKMDLATCTQVFDEYRQLRYPKTRDVIERSESIGRMRTGTSFLERTYRHFVFHVMFLNNAMLYKKIMQKETQSAV